MLASVVNFPKFDFLADTFSAELDTKAFGFLQR